MRKILAVIGSFVLVLVLSAVLCIAPGTNRQAYAEHQNSSDAAIPESNFGIVVSSLATVLGVAVVAKHHLISKIH